MSANKLASARSTVFREIQGKIFLGVAAVIARPGSATRQAETQHLPRRLQ
jgi:hypothetical protein